jgi:hypothetical protein
MVTAWSAYLGAPVAIDAPVRRERLVDDDAARSDEATRKPPEPPTRPAATGQ